MLKPTNAQSISRVLRAAGYNPQSAGDSTKRWIGLLCSKSCGEVRVRVWENFTSEEPSQEDRAVVAEIATLLTGKGYKIRYETGAHFLYVAGKEI